MLDDVIKKLQELYPQVHIVLWMHKGGKAKLFVDNHAILKYIQVDMLEDLLKLGGSDAERDMIKYFADLVENKYIKRKQHFNPKKGQPPSNLTENQIRYAIANTKSNMSAARFLHVCLATYKKYSSMYGLYESHLNKEGRGVVKGSRKHSVKMEDVFLNKHPNYHLGTLKERLIKNGYLPEECQICGEKGERESDKQKPILLDFKDGNDKNMSLENLRFICYNCAFKIRGRVHIRFAKRLVRQMEKELSNPSTIVENDKSDDIFDKLNG